MTGQAVLAPVRAGSRRLERGDWHDGGRTLHAALSGVPDQLRAHPEVRRGWRRAGLALALDERWDDAGSVERALRVVAGGDVGRRLELEGTRAVGLALAGRTAEALRASAGVRRVAVDAAMTTLCAELDLADALAVREAGDERAAALALERASRAPTLVGWGPTVARLALVELRVETGRLDAAEELLAAVQEGTAGRSGPAAACGGASSSLASTGVRLALARDDVAAARSWSRHVTDPFWRPVAQARVHLARGEHAEAVEVVARSVPRCPRHEVVGGLLLARALERQDREAALKQAGVALELAAAHGMLRAAAGEGTAVADLVERAAWRVPAAWLDALRHVEAAAWTGAGAPAWPLERLTRREREVLRLLPGRLTLREVADELVVSPNTLKFHLRLIYRKLGAGSRTEAVAVARREGLLPRG